ncbi:MAG: hypothetical protein JO353_04900 [Phycisphaerae bacterium]|nr:hypothetical protein [Phycisphaerae bacterium]
MLSYAFSLDRAVWTGSFPNRQAALKAGLKHAREVELPPESIFVAQQITPDDRAYGHARGIAQTMRRRVLEDNGDVADGFLRGLTDRQLADLDSALEATIRQWMDRNNLRPSWVRYEAVSEYPVPALNFALR